MVELLALLKEVERRAPSWYRSSVLATGVGWKLSDRRSSDKAALSFIVRNKRPKKDLTRAERIPEFLDGVATDVLRASGELDLAARDHELLPGVGCGTGIYTAADKHGTIACTASGPEGQPLVVTSLHVAPRKGIDVWLYENEEPTLLLGRSVVGKNLVRGGVLYGPEFPLAADMFSVHAVAISVARKVSLRPGLQNGQAFQVTPPEDSVGWLKDARFFAYGIGTGVLRMGRFATFFPKLVGENARGFLLIQQHPSSTEGDSGGLWYGIREGRRFGVGIHRGQMRWKGQAYALVTDLHAALRVLEVSVGLPGVA